MHRWKVGLAPTGPAYRRRRRRRALTAERKARRRQRGIITGLLSARAAIVRLAVGPALTVVLLLSLGLWAIMWAAVGLAVSALR